MKKTVLWLLAVLLLSSIRHADAQQIPRIAALYFGTRKAGAVSIDAFQRGLRELGYIEGKTVAVDYRYADGKEDRYSSLAAELVALKPLVIVTWGTDLTACGKENHVNYSCCFCASGPSRAFGACREPRAPWL